METVCVRGYAKINLHLDITGRLEGGYHQVETVMQSISLFDEITLIPRDEAGFAVFCNVPGVPTDEKNLAVRAALLFAKHTGISTGAQIVIDKQIPMAAGMAGGSADAAAVLRGMNRLYGSPLSRETLCALGATLGADVPFCVVGGTAYADGRGDVLHDFPRMPACHIVASCAGEGVSTPWAYGLLDRLHGEFQEESLYRPRSVEPLRAALTAGALLGVTDHLYNIFEEPILAERPVASAIRRLLIEAGALRAMMSGSGPSVFGIFESAEQADLAAQRLRQAGYPAYACTPQDTIESD